MALLVQLTFAQQKTVSGTVSDENGLPLIGATVVIVGTSSGTTTDFDGNYKITASQGDVLNFSYVGYSDQSITVGASNTINTTLQLDNTLDEVVVTAQGIKREKKALGYAVTTLTSESVENKPEADIARVLSGKIAGVNVVGTGGIAGSGTNITIRGNISITGNNQPLFVVNGVPFNTNTNAESNVTTGNGSVSASSRFLDLDPNNIESMSVLKGLSATVLYGDAGRNGVILITTKSNSTGLVDKGFEISVNQSVFFNEIANLPNYQNTYGQGGDNSANVGFVGNWGNRFSDNLTVRHHYNLPRFANSFPQFQGATVPYQAVKDNVKNFFRNGLGTSTSINASKGSENMSYAINFGQTVEEGYVPKNKIKRINFGLGGNIKLSNKFRVSGSFNFSTSSFETPPVAANNGTGNFSIFTRTLFIPRNVDLNGLPFQDPLTGASVYYRTDQENPLWLVNNSKESIDVNRFYNSISTTYDFSNSINLTYRVGIDTYTENQQFYVNKGGVSSLSAQQGFLKNSTGTNTIWDHSLILRIKDVKFSEKFNFNASLGFNTNSEIYKKFGVFNSGQVVFGYLDQNNFSSQSNTDPLGSRLDFEQRENTLGAYSQLTLDYSNFLYLTLAGRNDWSSTLETANRSLFYPSASLAFVPTSSFPSLKSDFINFVKVRAGYGTSSGFPSPYNTRQTLAQNTSVFTPASGTPLNTNSSSRFFANPDLKAELHKEFEIGLETRLWNNKIDLEISAYTRDSEDQILTKTLASSTGFGTTFINAGKIETQGLEVNLGITPFKGKDGMQWNSNFIFSAYENEVKDLPDGDEIFIQGFSNLGNYAIEGQPLSVIRGNYAVRDTNGKLLINPSTGNIIESGTLGLDDKIIGDPNADWRLTNINTLSYKGISLSAQVEYVHGGDFSSNTIANLLRRGVTRDTEDREGTTVIPGILADPTTGIPLLDANGNQIANTIQQGANEVYFINYIDPSGQQIYDASVLRLREVSLTYSLPKSIIDKTPFGSFSITFLANNIYYWAPNVPKYTNFDPEALSTGVGNGAGLELGTAPTSKKYGFSIKATF